MSCLGDMTVIGHGAKFAVAFPLVFHYLGGVRHLAWDRKPEMLENADVEQSSKILVGASVGLSVVAAML
eukprot:CAMPEP_0181300680 /NCGR_PEP_ID=MMETSP1101-20121128/7019_1 /TAXON_ID=46948 /ORGANISM="Rhodomonas abbreviata, Strain Caron Lab Isolate" /LENGTH=68 /DNA_ID=CAMNT_0023405933 /DNA_START=374 /DNA_END=580 /DNA_ORIENTATION=+